MLMQALDDQRKANQQEKSKRQHLDCRVALDEIPEKIGQGDHAPCCYDHGSDHHWQLVHHAHGGDDRIQRENGIQE